MNRNLLALGLLLAVPGTAHAQFGLTAGLNFTALATKTNDEHHHATARGRPGYQLGVFYEKRVSPRWSGLVGLNYSHQATDLSVEEFGAAGYEASRNRADVGAVAVEADAAGHHFHVLLLQAGSGAVLAGSDAGIEGVEEGLVPRVHDF